MKFYVVGILSWTIVTMIQWILLLLLKYSSEKGNILKIFMIRMLMEMTIIVTLYIIKIFHNIMLRFIKCEKKKLNII